MYAITATGYRAINSDDDAAPDEIAVVELPQHLLDAIAGERRRSERNARLRVCDWTQMADAPLSEAQRSAWAAYRQSLRDLPEAPDWPRTPYPTMPELPSGAAGVGQVTPLE